jgi:hypothetical protein
LPGLQQSAAHWQDVHNRLEEWGEKWFLRPSRDTIQSGRDPLSQRNQELLAEATELIERAERDGLGVRLLGGLAVLAHCDPTSRSRDVRSVGDIDLVVEAGQQRRLSDLLEDRHYQPELRFNALNGHRRMVFHGAPADVDVIVGAFEMCHRIELRGRLHLDFPTITVADLLFTKLQIVRLTEKDVSDIVALVAHHDLGPGEGDQINLERVEALVRDDWGLWRTAMATIDVVSRAAEVKSVKERLAALRDALSGFPKTFRWRIRSRIGDRVCWYVLPDEVRQ